MSLSACTLDFDRYYGNESSVPAEASAGPRDAADIDASALPAPGDGAADVVASDGGGTLDDGLTAFYQFDETNGTSAIDSSGNARTAMLLGGASFAAGVQGNAASVSGAGQYVAVPAEAVRGLTSFSICVWFNLSSVPTWSRIFEFGTGTTVYMFLTAKSDTNSLRFAISTEGNSATKEQRLEAPSLPAGSWHHVAVTLNGTASTLYVDGTSVDTKTLTLNPTSLGTTTNNWLGRSSFNDPYLQGRLDKLRIYSRALGASEVQSLVQQRQ